MNLTFDHGPPSSQSAAEHMVSLQMSRQAIGPHLSQSLTQCYYTMDRPSAGPINQSINNTSLHVLFLRTVHTIGNLIDIPSTLQLERLQQQEAQNRSNEYITALNTVKLPEQAIKKLHSMTSVVKGGDISIDQLDGALKSSASSTVNSVRAPSVREVLAEKTIDSKTLGWMASAMGELHQATEQIDVEDVGDLIVTLSPPVA
ncbi:hypothetical protein BC939DRAFT_2218 [Gamsiella multidivaricata]|uniref:uncharacterized protein n=1 Tax=Gamsiella multidivaricata TaxID=101098 RepID=UPI00221E9AF6|nr:uncharacterized protein BC939DRAFT_2218 [Gamsiella multidivaricata]KAI7832621.1 hypothetical protein BC939DRAFT_2218 [Gamsiella multidivaricata]